MIKPALRAHPIAELVPDMTPDQYSALRHDIREHSLRTPIVMYEGMVLDGRNRARAWYDVRGSWDAPSTEFKGTTEEAIAFVRSHNIKRRHLKPSQIAYYEAQAAAFWKAQSRPTKKGNFLFRDAEANCQGGWRQYRDHRARRQGSKGRARGWSLPARRQDQRQPRAEGCQPARRRAFRCALQATAAQAGKAQAAADSGSARQCLCRWLARREEACARLAKDEGSYGLAAKMRALKHKAPYSMTSACPRAGGRCRRLRSFLPARRARAPRTDDTEAHQSVK